MALCSYYTTVTFLYFKSTYLSVRFSIISFTLDALRLMKVLANVFTISRIPGTDPSDNALKDNNYERCSKYFQLQDRHFHVKLCNDKVSYLFIFREQCFFQNTWPGYMNVFNSLSYVKTVANADIEKEGTR